jgi:hypothetical protein
MVNEFALLNLPFVSLNCLLLRLKICERRNLIQVTDKASSHKKLYNTIYHGRLEISTQLWYRRPH